MILHTDHLLYSNRSIITWTIIYIYIFKTNYKLNILNILEFGK